MTAARQILIHIGPHKTGTTAIQQALLRGREQLARANISYPEIGFDSYGHHKIAYAMGRSDFISLDRFAVALSALSGTVVLSSENFSRVSPHAVRSLAERLAGYEVKVIFYLRNLIKLMYVWWQERVKHGAETDVLAHVAECFAKPFSQHLMNPTGMLNNWGEAFGSEAIYGYIYDEIPDVAEQFFIEVLQVPYVETESRKRRPNKSYDIFATELMRTINSCGFNGLSVLQSGNARELLSLIREIGPPYRRQLKISFDMFVLATIEKEFVRCWGNRLHGGGGKIFATREGVVPYLDRSLWALEDRASHNLRSLLEALPTESRLKKTKK